LSVRGVQQPAMRDEWVYLGIRGAGTDEAYRRYRHAQWGLNWRFFKATGYALVSNRGQNPRPTWQKAKGCRGLGGH
jgi:hypothetical protein